MIRVLTAPASTALLDLARVKEELGLTGTADDDALGGVIAAVTKGLERDCWRYPAVGFGLATVEETVRLLDPDDALVCGHWPVVAVTGVSVAGIDLAPADWETDRRMIYRLADDARVVWPACKIVITYQAGYALPDGAPEDLAAVALAAVRRTWLARARDPGLVSVSVEGVGSRSYASAGAGRDLEQATAAVYHHRYG